MIVNDYQMMTDGFQQSPLTKYCPLIRKPGYHLNSIRCDVEGKKSELTVPLSDAQWSTIYKSFCHFMTLCTHLNALVLGFNIQDDRYSESVKVIADSAVQHLRHLSIHGFICEHAFKHLMTQCPPTLETLELSITAYANKKYPSVIEANEAGLEPLSSLRRLTLSYDDDLFRESLSSFWGRCKSVEALELTIRSGQSPRHMATIMETFFPNLSIIHINESGSQDTLEDEDLARVLSVSRLGWRSVSIMRYLEFGERSWETLLQHASTLENFTRVNWRYKGGPKPSLFLTSFPRLQSFVMLAQGDIRRMDQTTIRANEWIHQDPLSRSLTPWPCEHSLTDLRIEISGIPRPDIVYNYHGRNHQPVAEGSHHGEGRMIQHRVYERLSRFVNLEVLWLGHVFFDSLQNQFLIQNECLEMSLESGLGQLEGLKRLQVLNVSLMATRIGQAEAQWMAEHWPRLREIRGLDNLDGRGDARKARRWFERNCSRISTPLLNR